MRRDQLEHAIRAACQIAGLTEVIIVGSQAILGTYHETRLPVFATRSLEIDVLPIADNTGEIARLADEIEGVAGEFSPFAQTHGFSIDGVDLSTSVLAEGWRDRLVKVQNANTAAPSGEPQFIGWCLDKEDLCVAKLCALREKDENFVDALITAGLVDPHVIATRLAGLPDPHRPAAERAANWLAHRTSNSG
jgi:SAM-dependent methyltransferase